MANIELQYYDGSTYQILYPKIAWANNSGGTIATTNIPSLAASKITSGTFDAARIPSLSASKISGGTFASGSDFTFPNNVRIKNTSNYGMKLNFGDGDYVYLYEDSDDNLTIKAKRIEFTTTSSPGITNNGSALGGGGGVTYEVNDYTGTGTYGSSNRNKITFSKDYDQPLLLVISYPRYPAWGLYNFSSSSGNYMINSIYYSSTSIQACQYVNYTGTYVQWYCMATPSPDATYKPMLQLNSSGESYYYMILGA